MVNQGVFAARELGPLLSTIALRRPFVKMERMDPPTAPDRPPTNEPESGEAPTNDESIRQQQEQQQQ